MKLGVRSLSVLALSVVTSIALAAPVDDFRAASFFAWGAGTGLNPAYATLDMNVSLIIYFSIIPITVPTTRPVPEQPVLKTPGSLNFSFNAQNIDPTFPPIAINMPGTAVGNQVTWSLVQRFSTPGGFPINAVIDINGTPTTINIVVNDVDIDTKFRSDFAPVTPFYNPVILSNTNVRGTYSGGDTWNYLNGTTRNITGTIGGLTPSRIDFRLRRIQHISHVPYPVHLTGVCALSNITTNSAGEPVNWALYPVAGTTAVASGQVALGAGGTFDISTNAPVGTYRLSMKGKTHLAKIQTVVMNDYVSGLSFALRNGDVNNDNEVGPGDFTVLSANFGKSLGDSGYDARADLNRDDEVGPADFTILSASFGEVGDEP